MSAVPQGHPDRVGFEPEGPAPFTPNPRSITGRYLRTASVLAG